MVRFAIVLGVFLAAVIVREVGGNVLKEDLNRLLQKTKEVIYADRMHKRLQAAAYQVRNRYRLDDHRSAARRAHVRQTAEKFARRLFQLAKAARFVEDAKAAAAAASGDAMQQLKEAEKTADEAREEEKEAEKQAEKEDKIEEKAEEEEEEEGQLNEEEAGLESDLENQAPPEEEEEEEGQNQSDSDSDEENNEQKDKDAQEEQGKKEAGVEKEEEHLEEKRKKENEEGKEEEKALQKKGELGTMESNEKDDAEAKEEGHATQEQPSEEENTNPVQAIVKFLATDPEPHQADNAELTDPDETNNSVKKLVKHTNENLEKKTDGEVVINKGMDKNTLKKNGEIAKKTVKESQDKKKGGEEIIDKEANLEIDRAPNSDKVDPAIKNAAHVRVFNVANLAVVAAISCLLAL